MRSVRFKNLCIALGLGLALAGGTLPVQAAETIARPGRPNIMREFRGVWVATVANIDWPSTNTLTTAQQKQEIITILDKVHELHMNAVVLQVRAACDAFYDSKLEPWSDFLTGKQGQPPNPYYDPLTFWVEEAHKRGIELHCWFNPYRALHPASTGPVAATHISKTHPDAVKKYGDYLWLNPTSEVTKKHTMDVILDVVKRYDIDGVHMDDYFYPYKSYAHGADFPDDDTWQAYKKSGGTLSRGDWRRKAVDDLVESIDKNIKAIKPHVKFGISPFGIARPGMPPEVKSGFDQYNDLYADTQLWLNKGWVDYWTPQLYWKIASAQPFPFLVKWWMQQNTKHRQLWPGLYTGRLAETTCSVSEVAAEIVVGRAMGATGQVHFSMNSFLRDQSGINEMLIGKDGVYHDEALIPSCPWIDSKAPLPPEVHFSYAKPDAPKVTWTRNRNDESKDIWLWTLYWKQGGKWTGHVLPASTTEYTFTKEDAPKEIGVGAVDRNNNESIVTQLEFNRKSTDGKSSDRKAETTEDQVK